MLYVLMQMSVIQLFSQFRKTCFLRENNVQELRGLPLKCFCLYVLIHDTYQTCNNYIFVRYLANAIF